MPFTVEQFFEVFAKYNQSVFPMPFVLVWAAAVAVLLAACRRRSFDKIAALTLGFLWLWAGIVYHLLFFTRINSGAYIFGAMFIAQGIFFLYEGFVANRLGFRVEPNLNGYLGAVFIIYALLIYPLIGGATGHIFPATPTFGTPCPVTIFTFGMLLWTNRDFRAYGLIIPLLWAVVGATATWHFGVVEDYGLPVAAAVTALFIFRREFEPQKEAFL